MNSKPNPRKAFGRQIKALAIVSIAVLCAVFFYNPINPTSEIQVESTEEINYIPDDHPSRARDNEGDTFSIVAYDPVSGEIGGAGCSCYSGTIDFLSEPIRHPSTGVLLGAIHTQAAYNSTNQAAARARMEAGDTPQQIIDWLVANDPGSGTIGSRQYGIVGIDGSGNITTAGYTGSSNGNWAGDIQGVDAATGMHYSIQGNILDTSTAGSGRQDILDDMEAAFVNTSGSLADKLMAALQGAKRVGGDNRCTSSGTSGRAAFVKVLLPADPNDNSPSIDISLYPNISWIEPIDELQCAYDSAYTPPTCRETVNTYPYTMDFEEYMWIKDENNCSPSNATNSWIRSRHTTPTANTGPSAASQGQLYMFVEADQGTNDRAIITSPCFEIPSSGTTVITFDYHMFGASMGTLNLTVNDGSGWSTLWSRSGSQGNNWNFQELVDLTAYAGSTIRLRFDGTTGSGTTSDMAIDNIRIGTPPPPPPPVSCVNTIDQFDYAQGFEGTGSGGLGLWEQATGDDGNWVNFTGSTPSGNTGPSSANEGSYYMYIEASSNGTTGEIGANSTAILESPCFDLTYAQGVDFTFDYHSWGANAGSLVLQLSETDGNWIDIFSINGVDNNAWVPTTVALDGYTGQNIKLRFVGTTGGGFASDIAIDNLAMALSCRNTSEYTGGSWVGGTPTLSNEATITDSYTTATDGGSIDACELTVSTGATLRISAGDYLNVNGDITVNGGTLIVEHQANVVQLDPDATVSVINGGIINVEVETPPLKQRDFMLLGSPMTAETRNDVFSSSYNVQQHTPANFIPHPSVPAGGTNFMDDNLDDWNEYTSGNITPGEGFLVYPQAAYIDPAYNGPPPVSTIVFDLTYAEGTLNNGDISRSIEFNGLGTNPDGTPNFLANPYASAIDGSLLVSSNPLINEVYFWEHLTPPSAAIPGANTINVSMGDLSIYNGTMGIPAANDPGTSTTPIGVISTAQGFGIKAFGAGTVTFDNSMRLTTGNSTLRAPQNLDKIVLKVQAETYDVRGYAGIGFRPEGTADLDENMDSNRLATLVSLYSHLEDGTEQLGIQTREPFDSSLKIPMGFATQVKTDLEYTISISTLEGSNLSSSQIYLIDNELGVITDLTETNYHFRSNKGEFNGRFTIQFEPDNTLASNSNTLDNIAVYPNPATDILNIQSNSISIKDVEVFDIQGRRIITVSADDQTSVNMNISSYKSGIYFVKINTVGGSTTRKIIKR